MGNTSIQLQTTPRVETSLHVSQALIQSLEVLAMPQDELLAAIERTVDENPALCMVTHKEKGKREHIHLVLENQLTDQPSLFETIMLQARDEFDEDDLKIVEVIAGNVNEKGFFEGDLNSMCNVSQKKAETVLTRFMHLDPIGIGARNPGEALLIQARHKKLRCAEAILKDHYELLLKKRHKQIARELEITEEEVK